MTIPVKVTVRQDGTEVQISEGAAIQRSITVLIDGPSFDAVQRAIWDLSETYPLVQFTLPMVGADNHWHAVGRVW